MLLNSTASSGLTLWVELERALGQNMGHGVQITGGVLDALEGDEPRNQAPLVLVLGNERSGLSARVRAICSIICPLEGPGRLQHSQLVEHGSDELQAYGQAVGAEATGPDPHGVPRQGANQGLRLAGPRPGVEPG